MTLDKGRERTIVVNAARVSRQRRVTKKRLGMRTELASPLRLAPHEPRLDRMPRFAPRHINKAALFGDSDTFASPISW